MKNHFQKGLIVVLLLMSLLLGATLAYGTTTIVYNGDEPSGWTGWGTFYTTSGSGHGYDGNCYWNYTSTSSVDAQGYWIPALGSGYYNISVFVPDYYTTAPDLKYWVYRNSGNFTDVIVSNYNQRVDEWVWLGRFQNQGSGYGVTLMSGYQNSDDEYMAFDEVRFVN